MFEFYGFIRNQAKDAESKKGEGGLAMPAGYMFKEPPGWDAEELGDPVEFLIAEHDRHDIRKAIVSVEDEQGARAVREHPDRFFAAIGVDPNEGMEAVRKIERYADEFDLKCVGCVPGRPEPAGRGRRQEVVPDLREVRRARHPVRVDDGRARVRASRSHPRTSPASTRSAGTSPS